MICNYAVDLDYALQCKQSFKMFDRLEFYFYFQYGSIDFFATLFLLVFNEFLWSSLVSIYSIVTWNTMMRCGSQRAADRCIFLSLNLYGVKRMRVKYLGFWGVRKWRKISVSQEGRREGGETGEERSRWRREKIWRDKDTVKPSTF